MEIKQKTFIETEKDGKLVQLVVDNDMPLGILFDALMELKGYVVERMVKAQKEEKAEAKKQMPTEEKPEEKKAE